MEFHAIDGYLLDGSPSKADAIGAALRDRVTDDRALPFYRGLEAVGLRAADEALMALRLVIAGKTPGDEAIRRLRGLVALVNAKDAGAIDAAFAKAGPAVADLLAVRGDSVALAAAARAAYRATF